MAGESQEKRKYPRHRCDFAVTVYTGAGPISSTIVQISLGGCLIHPTLPAQPEPAIRLSFRLAEDMPPVNCKGEIVYSIADRGTGVAFTEISAFCKELIATHFEQRSAFSATQAG